MRLALSLLLPAAAYCQSSPEEPLTDTQKTMVRQGIRLHDEGKFSEAIERYKTVIGQNPKNALVWYELGFAQSALKDWAACIESGRRGLEFESRSRARLGMLTANCLDAAGQSEKALETYADVLAKMPPDADPIDRGLIHFNAGVTHAVRKDDPKAIASFQSALASVPRHASSHLQLAEAYLRTGRKVPAILALGVFLAIEPADSPRAPGAAALLRRLMEQGAAQTGRNQFSITISPPSRGDPEGDFGPEDLALTLANAGEEMVAKTKKTHVKPAFVRLSGKWTLLLEVLLRADRAQDTGSSFSARTYFPFYRQIVERKLTGAFVSAVFLTAPLPSSKEEKETNSKGGAAYREFVDGWGVATLSGK